MVSVFLRRLASSIIISTTDWAKIKSNDIVIVYHGTDLKGIEEIIYGLDATQPHYRYYNAPRHPGLFVAPDKGTAKDFGKIILTLRVRVKNLHGTDYGGNIMGKKDDAIFSDAYPESFRPSLSRNLMGEDEPQALFVGLLKPKDIVSVEINGKEMSRDKAIEELGFGNWDLDLASTKLDPEDLVGMIQKNKGMDRDHVLKGFAYILRGNKDPEELAEKLYVHSGFGVNLGQKAAKALAPKLIALLEDEGLI